MKPINLAICGATGMVGQKLLEVLEEKSLKINNLYLYASHRSAGKKITFKNKEYEVLELKPENVLDKQIDYALFMVGSDLSKTFAPIFVSVGAIVIDNSSAFRMDENVPLVIPEVNMHAVKAMHKIIANPNCSTIQAVVALAPLHKKFKIKRIVFSTYQAVSGAGQGGWDDLLNGEEGKPPKKFPHPIYDNILPHIDSFTDDGYTKEEHKMINETRKILEDESLKITATTVRVPVFNGHSESVNVEFETPVTAKLAKKLLAKSKGIVVMDSVSENIYPMPKFLRGKDEVFVGRIRQDFSVESGLNMWIVADNIRKGAATNAVQIMEALLKKRK